MYPQIDKPFRCIDIYNRKASIALLVQPLTLCARSHNPTRSRREQVKVITISMESFCNWVFSSLVHQYILHYEQKYREKLSVTLTKCLLTTDVYLGKSSYFCNTFCFINRRRRYIRDLLIFISEVACPKLVAPAHGKIHLSNRYYKSMAHITCDEGYAYTKPEYVYRECMVDVTWSGEEGTCESKLEMSHKNTISTWQTVVHVLNFKIKEDNLYINGSVLSIFIR